MKAGSMVRESWSRSLEVSTESLVTVEDSESPGPGVGSPSGSGPYLFEKPANNLGNSGKEIIISAPFLLSLSLLHTHIHTHTHNLCVLYFQRCYQHKRLL
jgi:hypothetical protein